MTLYRMNFARSFSRASVQLVATSGIPRYRAISISRRSRSIGKREDNKKTREKERGGEERVRAGERVSLTFICGARWRNVEKSDWRQHVGGNSLRKRPAPRCIITLSARRVIMLSFFEELTGESGSKEI